MVKIKPQDIVIGQDTREQMPYNFSLFDVVVEKVALPYGDYTLLYPDLRQTLIVERKSIDDFTQCCGNWRDRFERELLALRGYKYAYVVGEFSYLQILGHCYKSKIHPHSVIGSIAKWQNWGIKFAFLENRDVAIYYVLSLFRNIAEAETKLAESHCQQYSQPTNIPTAITQPKPSYYNIGGQPW